MVSRPQWDIMERILDTLILSDVHLGSEVSRAGDAVHLLESLRYRRLILLGDIFCDLNFDRLKRDHWMFLSCIRKLSNPKRNVEVVWVEGNHDHGLSKLMSHLVGVPVYQRYVWEYARLRHLAIHGHQFDRFVSRNAFLSRFGELLFYRIQQLDGKAKAFSRFLDRMNTSWLRMEEKVAEGALTFARNGCVDRVFCGHTHVATSRSRNGVWYYNTGSWIDAHPTYITVDDEGVNIHAYQPRVDDHYPGEEREPEPAAAAGVLEPAGLSVPLCYESVRC